MSVEVPFITTPIRIIKESFGKLRRKTQELASAPSSPPNEISSEEEEKNAEISLLRLRQAEREGRSYPPHSYAGNIAGTRARLIGIRTTSQTKIAPEDKP